MIALYHSPEEPELSYEPTNTDDKYFESSMLLVNKVSKSLLKNTFISGRHLGKQTGTHECFSWLKSPQLRRYIVSKSEFMQPETKIGGHSFSLTFIYICSCSLTY